MRPGARHHEAAWKPHLLETMSSQPPCRRRSEEVSERPLRRAREGERRPPGGEAKRHELVGERLEMPNDAGADRVEERQDLAPHPRPEKARVPVRRIVGGGQRVTCEMRTHVRAARTEEGTYELERRPVLRSSAMARGQRSTRGQYREAGRPCAAEEAEEERLGAVVCVVRRGDRRRAGRACRPRERGEALLPRASVHVASGRDDDAGAREGNTDSRRDLLREIQLRGRRFAEAVVDAVGDHPQSELAREPRRDVEERDRVRPAARRDEERLAPRQGRLAAQRAAREGQERGEPRHAALMACTRRPRNRRPDRSDRGPSPSSMRPRPGDRSRRRPRVRHVRC